MKLNYAFTVLNWNGEEDTKKCLKSLDAVEYDSYEVILVDNGSEAESVKRLHKFVETLKCQIKFIELPKNTGFTGGHIEGLKTTEAEVVCLLNNDAVVSPNILKETDSIRQSMDGEFGALGGRAYFWNKEQKALDIWNEFFTYQKIDPITAVASTIKGDPGESLAPKVVDTVSGACVFVSRKAIEAVGFLDEMFFAYYEETDLFARFKVAGFEVYYCPTIRYWHRFEPAKGTHGASSGHIKDFSTRLILRNQFYFAFRNFEKDYLVKFLRWYYVRFFKTLVMLPVRFNSHSKIIIKTTVSNLIKTPSLLKSRRDNLQNSRSLVGYNTRIINDANKKTVVFTKIPEEEKFLNFIETEIDPENRIHFRSGKCAAKFKHRCVKLNSPETEINALAAACSRTNVTIVAYSAGIKLEAISVTLATLQKKSNNEAFLKVLDGVTIFNRAHALRLAEIDYAVDEKVDWSQNFRSSLDALVKFKHKTVRTLTKGVRFPGLMADYFKLRVEKDSLKILPRMSIGMIKNTVISPKGMLRTIQHDVHQYRVKNQTLVQDEKLKQIELGNFKIEDIPVFINCRDRVEALKKSIKAIERAGFTEIYLVDNQSSYPDLKKFYEETEYQVVLLDENMGHKAPWQSMAVSLISAGRPYVVTDPDVVLSDKYEPAVISKMLRMFDEYQAVVKIGAGLSIDDLPDSYAHKNTVQKWEKQFWLKELKTKTGLKAFDAEIDTTFAIYRPNLPYITVPAIRIGGKYIAKHLPWYQDSENPSEEELYYSRHASSAVNTWNKEDLPGYLQEIE